MHPAWLTDTLTSDLDRALHYTLLWGLEALELRTVGGPSERVPFVNESKLKRRLAECDVPVAAVVPGMFEGPASDRIAWMNEVAAFEDTLAFCRRVGCMRVVVSAFAAEDEDAAGQAVEPLVRAGTAAARHGVTLAVLNEWQGAHPTGAALAALLDAVDHTAVQAAWSPAAALRAGEDPMAGLAALERRIALVRCRNGRGQGENWHPTPLDAGGVDWPAQLSRLHELGFDGPVSLEIDVEPKPKAGLAHATRLIEMLRDV